MRENWYSEKDINNLQKDFTESIIKDWNSWMKEIKEILWNEFWLKAYKFIRKNQNDKFEEKIKSWKTKKETWVEIINEVLQVWIEKK